MTYLRATLTVTEQPSEHGTRDGPGALTRGRPRLGIGTETDDVETP